MWWNFVARTPDEIAQARADWEAQRRFGEVKAYAGPRLAAPALTRLARPNPVSESAFRFYGATETRSVEARSPWLRASVARDREPRSDTREEWTPMNLTSSAAC